MLGFVLLPSLLFAFGARRGNVTLMRWTAAWTVLGIVVNRLNVSVIAFNWDAPDRYVPSWMEVMVSITLVTIGVSVVPLDREPDAGAARRPRIPRRVDRDVTEEHSIMIPHDILTLYSAKMIEYGIAVLFLLLFIPFWRFVQGSRAMAPAPATATVRAPTPARRLVRGAGGPPLPPRPCVAAGRTPTAW